MSESKVYMFPELENNTSNLMAMMSPLLQLRSIDPGMLALLNNNGGFGGNNGMWFIWILFLWMFWGGNGFGNGFGGNDRFNPQFAGLANQLNNDAGRELLMQAISGNGNAITNLASTLNSDINSVQTALNQLQSSICSVGNQVGMSSLLIINAIQAGNCLIGSLLAQCCCNIQDAITRQGYENLIAISNQTNALLNSINTVATGQDRGFASVAFETQRQTCDIQNSIKDATETIIAGLRAAELREMQNKIDSLRELNSLKDVVINNGQLTALFSLMIQSATAPLAGALNGLQNDVNGIKCKLPDTTTIAYSPVVGVPSCVAALFGLNALGLNNGWFNNNSLWG